MPRTPCRSRQGRDLRDRPELQGSRRFEVDAAADMCMTRRAGEGELRLRRDFIPLLFRLSILLEFAQALVAASIG